MNGHLLTYGRELVALRTWLQIIGGEMRGSMTIYVC